MRQLYIIEKKEPSEDWLPVVAFPGMPCLYRQYGKAKEAVKTMTAYDPQNTTDNIVNKYRVVKYGPITGK